MSNLNPGWLAAALLLPLATACTGPVDPPSSTCTAGTTCALDGDPCHQGAIACATGAPVCLAGAALLDGTACGADQVCGAGTCVACAAGQACEPAGDPCHQGAIACATGAPVCVTGAAVPNGTSCGPAATCQAGGCVPAPLTCTTCHGSSASAAPPLATDGATAGVKVGAHQAHLAPGRLSLGFTCTACHPEQVEMGHQSGAVELAWSSLAKVGGLTPTPAVVDAAWEASPTCTNYCHGGKWATNVPYRGNRTAPSWLDGPAASACGACHRFPPASAAHQSVGPTTSCDNCHPGYRCTTGNPGACVVHQDRHLDGAMLMTDGFCVGCHGDVRLLAAGTLGAGEAPARLEASPPFDTSGASSSRAVGRHLSHVDPAGRGPQVAVPLRCAECHGLAVETYSSSHADGVRQVTFADATRARLGGVAATFTPGIGTAPGTCVTYCHGAGLMPPQRGSVTTWAFGGASAVGCGSCHASPPGDLAHATLSTPAAPATCNPCHAGTVDAAGKIVFTGTGSAATTLHIDGLVQATAPLGATCTSCHGSVSNAAPPTDTNGWTLGVPVGAHQRHLAPTLTSPAYQCNACHPVQTSQSHSNGVVDLAWGALARSGAIVPSPGSLGPTTVPTRRTWESAPTCTNYCHGAGWIGNFNYAGTRAAGVSWMDGAAARSCDACHRSPPLSASHRGVTGSTSCSTCHAGYDCVSSNLAACKVNAPYHIGGRLDCGGLPCGP